MKIRKSKPEDIDAILSIFDFAREFMQSTGNTCQWINGYPGKDLIMDEIVIGDNYVCESSDGEIAGVFSFIIGDDPTYSVIENGEWLDNETYGTLHRIASNGRVKGLADECIKWCFDQHPNLRADTHQDNTIVQKIFERNGFKKCGIIYVSNGTSRIAYHKNK